MPHTLYFHQSSTRDDSIHDSIISDADPISVF